MKYAVSFIAALLLVGASAFPLNEPDVELNELDRDILEFYELIPRDQLIKVTEEHIKDPELHKSLQYLMTDSLHKLVYAAEDLPQFHEYVLYLQAAGYDATKYLRQSHELLGMKDYISPKSMNEESTATFKEGGGLNGYIDDLIAILPKKEIQALHAKKAKESPAFAKFKAAVSSPKFTEIRNALYTQKPMQTLVQECKANGIDSLKLENFHALALGFVQ